MTSSPENKIGEGSAQFEAWVPKILDSLQANWADYLRELPDSQPAPNFSTWLNLIHAAATRPDTLPQHLETLLKSIHVHVSAPDDWVLISDLMNVTMDAAKAEAQQLAADDWQSMLEVQNRILTAAARLSPSTGDYPHSGILSKRALYLQIISELNSSTEIDSGLDEFYITAVDLIRSKFGFDYVNIFVLAAERQELTLEYGSWKTGPLQSNDLLSINLEHGTDWISGGNRAGYVF